MTRLASLASDAFGALRQHPLRSLLSVLGLVIGVAALVAVLSLADSMERYTRNEIATTTSLQNISVMPRTSETVDGVSLRRSNIQRLGLSDARALSLELDGDATVSLIQQRSTEVVVDTIRTAATLFAADAGIWAFRDLELLAGRLMSATDVSEGRPAVVLSSSTSERFSGDPELLIGRTVTLGDVEGDVIGVVDSGEGPPFVIAPITAFPPGPRDSEPVLHIRAVRAEDVVLINQRVTSWLDSRFEDGSEAFILMSDHQRSAQLRQGMLVFKLVFGFITGISVVVGGVGVMNVLLVTVTERTREIGIRKAVGARRRDILLQFLTEAMAVSGVGSVVGTVVGLVTVFVIGLISEHVTEVALQPALSLESLAVIAAVAVAVGLLFGTYPALRAARLSPTEAMRHE